jgi:hypothetical protein
MHWFKILLKAWGALFPERPVGFREVWVLHTDRLSLDLCRQSIVEVQSGFPIEHPFGDLQAKTGSASQPFGPFTRDLEAALGRHHRVVEPDSLRDASVNEVSGQEQLHGASQPHDPGQQPAGPHVGTGKAHFREKKSDSGAIGRNSKVASASDDGSGACDQAV